MSVTHDEVRRIASLAGLRVAPEEERELAQKMAELVRFAGEMEGFEGERDGDDWEAPSRGGEGVREAADGPGECLPRETVLSNAPDHRDAHVRLPAVAGGGRGAEETLE